MGEKLEQLISAWALLGGVLLIAIVLVTTLNVGAFTLDRAARLMGTTVAGLPGYEDFVRLAISAVGLMFFPYCQLRRGHVNVDLFAQHFPHVVQRILDALWLVVTAVMAVGLGLYGAGLAGSQKRPCGIAGTRLAGMAVLRARHYFSDLVGYRGAVSDRSR